MDFGRLTLLIVACVITGSESGTVAGSDRRVVTQPAALRKTGDVRSEPMAAVDIPKVAATQRTTARNTSYTGQRRGEARPTGSKESAPLGRYSRVQPGFKPLDTTLKAIQSNCGNALLYGKEVKPPTSKELNSRKTIGVTNQYFATDKPYPHVPQQTQSSPNRFSAGGIVKKRVAKVKNENRARSPLGVTNNTGKITTQRLLSRTNRPHKGFGTKTSAQPLTHIAVQARLDCSNTLNGDISTKDVSSLNAPKVSDNILGTPKSVQVKTQTEISERNAQSQDQIDGVTDSGRQTERRQPENGYPIPGTALVLMGGSLSAEATKCLEIVLTATQEDQQKFLNMYDKYGNFQRLLGAMLLNQAQLKASQDELSEKQDEDRQRIGELEQQVKDLSHRDKKPAQSEAEPYRFEQGDEHDLCYIDQRKILMFKGETTYDKQTKQWIPNGNGKLTFRVAGTTVDLWCGMSGPKMYVDHDITAAVNQADGEVMRLNINGDQNGYPCDLSSYADNISELANAKINSEQPSVTLYINKFRLFLKEDYFFLGTRKGVNGNNPNTGFLLTGGHTYIYKNGEVVKTTGDAASSSSSSSAGSTSGPKIEEVD